MPEEFAENPEVSLPNDWDITTLKEKLLAEASGELLRPDEFPKNISLNERWKGILESVYPETSNKVLQRIPFAAEVVSIFGDHTEEAKILKTNPERNKILIQKSAAHGNSYSVRPDTHKVRGAEVLVGILHKHPAEVLFSAEDILPLLGHDGHLMAGIVTPGNYYLAFRTQELKYWENDTHLNLQRLVAFARKHNEPVFGNRVTREPTFTVTGDILKDIGMPLYKGRRNQMKLVRIN